MKMSPRISGVKAFGLGGAGAGFVAGAEGMLLLKLLVNGCDGACAQAALQSNIAENVLQVPSVPENIIRLTTCLHSTPIRAI
jgi:hypothetical protein